MVFLSRLQWRWNAALLRALLNTLTCRAQQEAGEAQCGNRRAREEARNRLASKAASMTYTPSRAEILIAVMAITLFLAAQVIA